MERILVIGANGQIGCELVEALAEKYGTENVISADIGTHSVNGAEYGASEAEQKVASRLLKMDS